MRILLSVVFSVALAFAAPAKVRTQSAPAELADARQMLLVTTGGWDAVDGTLRRFTRPGPGTPWTEIGEAIAIVVGKNGLAWADDLLPRQASGPVKKEGDGKAPAGVFRLGPAFGRSRAPLAGLRLRYMFLGDDVECVDDAASGHYNQLTTRARAGKLDWTSSEKMWEQPLYAWGIVVDYNTRPVRPGAGSCIFLHLWRGLGQGTAGCTAMAMPALTTVLQWLDAAKHPVLVQLPQADYERLRPGWNLP